MPALTRNHLYLRDLLQIKINWLPLFVNLTLARVDFCHKTMYNSYCRWHLETKHSSTSASIMVAKSIVHILLVSFCCILFNQHTYLPLGFSIKLLYSLFLTTVSCKFHFTRWAGQFYSFKHDWENSTLSPYCNVISDSTTLCYFNSDSNDAILPANL